MTNNSSYSPKDFASDLDIRWCPGCGDFAILKQIQMTMPKLGIPKEDIVFISGIGCSSRFPYYMNTYGLHTIHGRAPAFATGLKCSRPELSIWVVTGDGDGLSIGSGHLAHILRRNVDVNILLFNNEIYGLTKGQFSPTSEKNKITKSSPNGNPDAPLNACSFAFGSNASFIARTMDRENRQLQALFLEAERHRGTSFIEIYQNCNIFNDGAFSKFSDRSTRKAEMLILEEGKPLIFGHNDEFCIRWNNGSPKIEEFKEQLPSDVWVHETDDWAKASFLTQFTNQSNAIFSHFPTPFGVIFQQKRPIFSLNSSESFHTLSKEDQSNRLKNALKGENSWLK